MPDDFDEEPLCIAGFPVPEGEDLSLRPFPEDPGTSWLEAAKSGRELLKDRPRPPRPEKVDWEKAFETPDVQPQQQVSNDMEGKTEQLAQNLKLTTWPFVSNPDEVNLEDYRSKDGKGEMACMDKTGDTKTIWDSKSPEEVENAKRQFEYFTKDQKYAAFAVDKKGEKSGEPLKAFDPNLEKIIFVKPLAGG